MHELSIAQSIVDIVGQYVPRDRQNGIRMIRVRVGDLAGVVPDSLSFCFTAVTAGTPMAEALLEIEHVPYIIHCTACATGSHHRTRTRTLSALRIGGNTHPRRAPSCRS